MIFLNQATFWDFIGTRLLNYISSAIQLHYPLLWRIFLISLINYLYGTVMPPNLRETLFMSNLMFLTIPPNL